MNEFALKLISDNENNQDTRLDLGCCGLIEIPNELFKCVWLEELILSNEWWDFRERKWVRSNNGGPENQLLSIPPEIANLSKLRLLDIGGKIRRRMRIVSADNIKSLVNLKYLNLSSSYIKDVNFLSGLVRLETLDISFNEINDAGALAGLFNLKILEISSNRIHNLSFLNNLEQLQVLNLSANRISDSSNDRITGLSQKKSDFSCFERLNKLRALDVSDNDIRDIGWIEDLGQLERFYASSNQISDLKSVASLSRLQILEIANNKVLDCMPLGKLINLKVLNLNSNRIRDISNIGKLTALKTLDLSNNEIETTHHLNKLIELETLKLESTRAQDYNFLKKLTGLRSLNLNSNKITELSCLEGLSKLEILNLNFNQISDLGSLGRLTRLRVLGVSSNPLKSPPPEIVRQGSKSILDWLAANRKKLNEIKIVLIGDPKAGKTSLLRKLKDDSFDENEQQTDGINIEKLVFKDCKTFEKYVNLNDITAHFWDFGGQEIMSATHQFFLTSRSIYLLVLDARRDADVTGQIRQWVKRIKATSGNSPIIVIANQADINEAFGFLNETELKVEFRDIKYFLKTSCKTGRGLNELKQMLNELVPRAEMFETEIDERWIAIKDQLELETKSSNFLSETRFTEICITNGLEQKSGRLNAIRFLHDLGLVLHFDVLNLSEYYVLDPYWITYGVYQIITSQCAAQMMGIVPMAKLEYIVNEEEDKRIAYRARNYKKVVYDSPNQRRFLVDILNQFKLCFYFNDRSHFIIPDLLGTVEPKYATQEIKESVKSISFAYRYEYLPKSVMPYIMVETHYMITKMWRTGCILESDSSRALISSYKDTLTITVTGEHKKKREFMAVIRNYIDNINHKLNDRPKMLVPLPDIQPTAYAEYEVLLIRETKGKNYIFDEDKPTEREFQISELLDGIASPGEVIKISQKDIEEIKHGIKVIINNLDEHYSYLIKKLGDKQLNREIIEAIQQLNEQQVREITSQVLQLIGTAFDVFGDDMDERLQNMYYDLKKTDDIEMKLKFSIPFIKLLGIDLEASFDVKSWAQNMYEKYEFKIFELMY